MMNTMPQDNKDIPTRLLPRREYKSSHLYCPRRNQAGEYWCGKRNKQGWVEPQMRTSMYAVLTLPSGSTRIITWWRCPKCKGISPGFYADGKGAV